MSAPRSPAPPWADIDESTVYPLVLRRSADALADRLEARVKRLRSDGVTSDMLNVEIRKQMAAAAIDDPIFASDLADLLLELVWCKENAQRAV